MRTGPTLRLLRTIGLLGLLIFASSCVCVYPPSDYLPSVRKVKIRPFVSETTIRAHVLRYTPIGCSRSNVLEFVQARLEHEYSDPIERGPVGRPVLPQGQRLNRFFGTRWPGPYEDVGVRSVDVCLGDIEFLTFPFPFVVDTYVDWAFDKDDRLIDVVVTKDRDSI